ncbi:MAG: type II secretion system protein [Phycisphaeraceae bacterium]|nr:type II secretion system protein [Phycisphaeraceae bacterium]
MRDRETQVGLLGATQKSWGVAARAAFTLIDLMVSIVIIAVLIGLLLPSIAKINEATRRVMCRSNMRQVSIGVSMYAGDNLQFLPRSQFVSSLGSGRASSTTTLRVDESGGTRAPQLSDYDGLGLLYSREYLLAPKIFYCPSNKGTNTFSKFAPQWAKQPGPIIGNFQYRGTMADGNRLLNVSTDAAVGALISDALTSVQDFSHASGLNVMRGDLSVTWLADNDKKIITMISRAGNKDKNVGDTWPIMDEAMGMVVLDR